MAKKKTTTRPTTGRPWHDAAAPRRAFVTFRLAVDELEALDANAARAGVTRSDYVLERLRDAGAFLPAE